MNTLHEEATRDGNCQENGRNHSGACKQIIEDINCTDFAVRIMIYVGKSSKIDRIK